jgi:hypothetical protein
MPDFDLALSIFGEYRQELTDGVFQRDLTLIYKRHHQRRGQPFTAGGNALLTTRGYVTNSALIHNLTASVYHHNSVLTQRLLIHFEGPVNLGVILLR